MCGSGTAHKDCRSWQESVGVRVALLNPRESTALSKSAAFSHAPAAPRWNAKSVKDSMSQMR